MPIPVEDRMTLLEQRFKEFEQRIDHMEEVAYSIQERTVKEAVLDMPDTFTVETRQFGQLTFSVYHPSHYKIELLVQTLREALKALEVPEEEPTVGGLLEWFEQSLKVVQEQGAMDYYYRALRIVLDPVADPDPANLSIPLEHAKCAPVGPIWQAWFKKITPFFSILREMIVLTLQNKSGQGGRDSASRSRGQGSTTRGSSAKNRRSS